MFLTPNRSRRDFLRMSGAGLQGLACASLFAQSSSVRPRATSVIFLFLVGGPSSIDTFDYKPELQRLDGQPTPESFKQSLQNTPHANVFHGCDDRLLGSPFSWQQYGESGQWVSDLFPQLATRVDDLCFIHSMQADSNNHAPASYQLHTGDVRAGKASLGSWVTYGLGSENTDLPAYVVLFDAGPLGGAANYSSGFLPPSYQPTRLRDQGTPVHNLVPPERFASRQRESIDFIQALNRAHQRTSAPADAGFPELEARINAYELAYRMQAAALDVSQYDAEPQHIHRLYALDHADARTQSFGRKCLMARRLVERGVRFVQLYDMPDKDGWDAHAKLKENHVPRGRWTDAPMAGLLTDLKQRGLLDTTLVICASEFGRTPMVQGDQGRQHNAAGFTIWLAGGGIRPGLRIGATDAIGLQAIERPVPFRDLHATILSALGIPFEDLFFEINGRQERITGVADSAHPLWDLFT